MTGRRLVGDDRRIDAALGALYDRRERDGGRPFGAGGRERAGGLGRSKPSVVRWLGDIRRYFPTPVVQILQRDAVERLDLRQLLLEPELLQSVEPDLHLVDAARRAQPAAARRDPGDRPHVIERVLADLAGPAHRPHPPSGARGAGPLGADPAAPCRRHRLAAHDRRQPAPLGAGARTVVPERLVGHGRRQPSLARDVVIAVDQCGSMADSVVYASLFAAVLAQLPTLRTRFIAFDTAVTDLTPYLHDPVEVLFGVQLGGGTDIAHALGYCRELIEQPRQSVLFVVSDLHEGGNAALMYQRVADMVASGVTVVVLLALSDDGAPAYDHANADALRSLGAQVLATTPDAFPDVLARALER